MKYCFVFSPIESLILLFNGLLCGLVPYLEIVLIENFVDRISRLVSDHRYSLDMIVLLIGLLLTLSLYDIGDVIDDYFEKKLQINLKLKYVPTLVKKISQIEYQYFEDETVVDRITNVLSEPEIFISNGFICVANILQVSIGIISVSATIALNLWWAGVLIFCLSIPLLFVSYRGGGQVFKLRQETQNINRYVAYLIDTLTNRENCVERTLFQYTDKLNDEFAKRNEELRKRSTRLNIALFTRSSLATILTLVAAFCVIGVLIQNTLSGSITASFFISTAISITTLMSNISGSFSSNLAEISADCEYVEEERNVLSYDGGEHSALEKNGKASLFRNGIECIEFKNVSFRYPFSKQFALKDVSFKLSKKSYAIVGTNGAGKSTIIKLLLKLYDSYRGEILINGISIANIPTDDLRREISVVFQDYIQHSFSFKENILIGDISKPFDRPRYLEVIKLVNLENVLKRLKNFDETVLGRFDEDDGVDLSGGEWQRVAIARALYSSSSLKILDEPASALDSKAEAALYELFGKLSKNNFSIIVSHRLASALTADEILVFNNGKLVEYGTPNQLFDKKGLFSHMYDEQCRWYINEHK